jgi:drug/metabolite transporter (DMT)-like permease
MSGQESSEAISSIFGAIAGNENIMNLYTGLQLIVFIGSILLLLNGLYRMIVPLPKEEFWGFIGRIIQICFACLLLIASMFVPLLQ